MCYFLPTNIETMTLKEFKSIKPDASGKYSKRLYEAIRYFVRKMAKLRKCSEDAILNAIQFFKNPKGDYFFGEKWADCVMGYRIRSVRRASRNAHWIAWNDLKPYKGFLARYKKDGICFLEPDHNWFSGHDSWEYSKNGKVRHCRHCGLRQVERSKIVKSRETWFESEKEEIK